MQSYEDQLSAAKFKAERDLARQELALWEKGYGQKLVNEIKYYLDEACEACGVDTNNSTLGKIAIFRDVVSKRLMPEGYEWPRYDNEKPVEIGDTVNLADRKPHEVGSIEFLDNHTCRLKDTEKIWSLTLFKGERVIRPQVLAADGEPIEIGQTVWDTTKGEKRTVTGFVEGEFCVQLHGFGPGYDYMKPSDLTHQRPVLDADGIPIKEGDTVYRTKGEGPLTVTKIEQSWVRAMDMNGYVIGNLPGNLTHTKPVQGVDGLLLKLGDTVYNDVTGEEYRIAGFADAVLDVNVSTVDGADTWVCHDVLTHTEPEPKDSWERIEKDTEKSYIEYWGCGKSCLSCPALIDGKKPSEFYGCLFSCMTAMQRDLVRRARKLAEKEAANE